MAQANDMKAIAAALGDLRERLGVQALQGAEAVGFQERNVRSFTAMMALLSASSEVAMAIGMHKVFRIMCADFAQGGGGKSIEDLMQTTEWQQ